MLPPLPTGISSRRGPAMPQADRSRTSKKSTQLKNLIASKELKFLIEVHNGLSAKIADETGFEGMWGSGLSISAACGVRDNNELSWTQVLDVVEYVTDATSCRRCWAYRTE